MSISKMAHPKLLDETNLISVKFVEFPSNSQAPIDHDCFNESEKENKRTNVSDLEAITLLQTDKEPR